VLSIFAGLLIIVSLLGPLRRNGLKTVQDVVEQLAANSQLQDLIGTVLDKLKDPGKGGIAAIIGIVVVLLVRVWLHRGVHARRQRRLRRARGSADLETLAMRVGVTVVVGLRLVVSAAIVIFTAT